MRYDSFAYITPPRAAAKIPVSLLDFYEKRGWWAQYKLNGTNSLVFIGPDRVPFAYNRHGERHKQWKFDQASARFFGGLSGKGWFVFNAELLHSKVSGGPRNTNYLHDLLVSDGQYLVGSTYAARYALLLGICYRHLSGQTDSHFILDANTWLARNIESGFKRLYAQGLTRAEQEGIVLKNPTGKLATTDGRGAPWLAKIRQPNKNLGF